MVTEPLISPPLEHGPATLQAMTELLADLEAEPTPARIAYALGYLDALADVGLISGPTRDDWVRRVRAAGGK